MMRSSAQRDRCTMCSAAKNRACGCRQTNSDHAPQGFLAGKNPQGCELCRVLGNTCMRTSTSCMRGQKTRLQVKLEVTPQHFKAGTPRIRSRGRTQHPWSWGRCHRPCPGRRRSLAGPRQRGYPPARLCGKICTYVSDSTYNNTSMLQQVVTVQRSVKLKKSRNVL